MSAAPRPLAKALHTVTVLVNVARLIQRLNNETRESAVQSALIALGYADAADPHGLAAVAIKQMKA